MIYVFRYYVPVYIYIYQVTVYMVYFNGYDGIFHHKADATSLYESEAGYFNYVIVETLVSDPSPNITL